MSDERPKILPFQRKPDITDVDVYLDMLRQQLKDDPTAKLTRMFVYVQFTGNDEDGAFQKDEFSFHGFDDTTYARARKLLDLTYEEYLADEYYENMPDDLE